jgi:hypothetical protein
MKPTVTPGFRRGFRNALWVCVPCWLVVILLGVRCARAATPAQRAAWVAMQEWASQPEAFDACAPGDVRRCRVTMYHPKEAGSNWRRWDGCRAPGYSRLTDLVPGPGGKVRPGVACVAASSWTDWRGKVLWIRGHGVFQCLDSDVYRGGHEWFDLAGVGGPWRYSEWWVSLDAVRRARDYSQRGVQFVVMYRLPEVTQ